MPTAAPAIIMVMSLAVTTVSRVMPLLTPLSLLRLQSWLSPAFPIGSYSYSHGLEWAVEAEFVTDQASLIEWLEADLCHGSGWNETIFFTEASRSTAAQDAASLGEIAALAAAYRGTSELALEASQQAASCLATLLAVWPDPFLETFSGWLKDCSIPPTLSVLMAVRAAGEGIPADLALPAFLQSYVANLATAGVRLIPLGQIGGQRTVAALEKAILSVCERSRTATVEDLGSAAFMVDLASAGHETQYTRLFRS